jgi:predicted amidohydrolase
VPQPLVVAVAQPATIALDVDTNAAAHAAAIRAAGARLVVFPEQSLTGYELAADDVDLDGPALAPVVVACRDTGAVALVGAPVDGALATVAVDGRGAAVAYRKQHLGGDEPGRFTPGTGPVVWALDGWRVGLGICKDTGVAAHVGAIAELGIDLYAAGLTHHDHELEEQDARGRRIADHTGAPVAFASFAGPTGGGYARTAGTSTIWSAAGVVLARAGTAPGEVVAATLSAR